MLGLKGVMVPLGMVLTLLSTILCIVYGLRNWNKGYITDDEVKLEKEWKKEETKVKEAL